MQRLQADAGAVLEQRRVQSDLELLLEARLNEDDLEECNRRMRADAVERDERYMKLFADFQVRLPCWKCCTSCCHESLSRHPGVPFVLHATPSVIWQGRLALECCLLYTSPSPRD